MREIEFRAWHKYDKKMCYGAMVGSHRVRWVDEQGFHESDDTINFPMQSTGVKDKNGKDIYEGDIISVWSEDGNPVLAPVRFGEAAFRFGVDEGVVLSEEVVEVTGNIYENPELIK